jgi:outer membrane receptor protein involved in Fe transport
LPRGRRSSGQPHRSSSRRSTARLDQRSRQHARRLFPEQPQLAFFTHNIVHINDQLDLTLGLRYTNERKRFDATSATTITPAGQQAALIPDSASRRWRRWRAA